MISSAKKWLAQTINFLELMNLLTYTACPVCLSAVRGLKRTQKKWVTGFAEEKLEISWLSCCNSILKWFGCKMWCRRFCWLWSCLSGTYALGYVCVTSFPLEWSSAIGSNQWSLKWPRSVCPCSDHCCSSVALKAVWFVPPSLFIKGQLGDYGIFSHWNGLRLIVLGKTDSDLFQKLKVYFLGNSG